MSPCGARRGMILVLFLLCMAPLTVFAADTAPARDRTKQTLLYGIDSQVLEAIQAIRNLKDTGFTRELARALDENRSVDRKSVV